MHADEYILRIIHGSGCNDERLHGDAETVNIDMSDENLICQSRIFLVRSTAKIKYPPGDVIYFVNNLHFFVR